MEIDADPEIEIIIKNVLNILVEKFPALRKDWQHFAVVEMNYFYWCIDVNYNRYLWRFVEIIFTMSTLLIN